MIKKQPDKTQNQKKTSQSPVNHQEPFQEDIPPELNEFIQQIPEEARQQVMMSLRVSKSYNGLLMPGSEIALWEKIYPGSANRILGLLEKQQDDRSKLEDKIVSKDYDQQARGQWMGFILVLVGFICVVILAYFDRTAVAITLIGILVALIGLFAYQRSQQSKKE